MKAFQVHLNNKPLCLAGIGNDGVLTVIVDYVAGGVRNESWLRVGGLITTRNEHVLWRRLRLKVGDQVTVRVVETDSVDRPKQRKLRDPASERKQIESYVRGMAKQFGWTIITRPGAAKTRSSAARHPSHR